MFHSLYFKCYITRVIKILQSKHNNLSSTDSVIVSFYQADCRFLWHYSHLLLKFGNDLNLPTSTHMSIQWRIGAQYGNMREDGILKGGTLWKFFRSIGGMMPLSRQKSQPCLVSQLQIPLLCPVRVCVIVTNCSMM